MPTNIGATPTFAIVNADGTPTRYFFNFLNAARQSVITTDDQDLEVAFSDNPLPAESEAIAHGDLFTPAAAMDPSAPGGIEYCQFFTPAAEVDTSALEIALILADRAPTDAGFPVIRDILANIPTGFNAGDDGRIFEATDYCHVYRWDGTAAAWNFYEGDASGYLVVGPPGGGPPNGGLWGLCDGSAYLVSQASGSTASVTTQNLTGGVFIKGASTPGTQQAATAPTLASGAILGDDTDAGVNLTVTAGTTSVAAKPHTHTVTDATGNAPSEANGGLPVRIGITFYMRR